MFSVRFDSLWSPNLQWQLWIKGVPVKLYAWPLTYIGSCFGVSVFESAHASCPTTASLKTGNEPNFLPLKSLRCQVRFVFFNIWIVFLTRNCSLCYFHLALQRSASELLSSKFERNWFDSQTLKHCVFPPVPFDLSLKLHDMEKTQRCCFYLKIVLEHNGASSQGILFIVHYFCMMKCINILLWWCDRAAAIFKESLKNQLSCFNAQYILDGTVNDSKRESGYVWGQTVHCEQ